MKFLVASVLVFQAVFADPFFKFDNDLPTIHQSALAQAADSSQQSSPIHQNYGAMQQENIKRERSELQASGRSTGSSVKSVSDILIQADAMNMMPDADEQAYLRWCLTKNVEKKPERAQNWDTMRTYLATKWFVIIGYLCGEDARCWKSIAKKFPQWPAHQRQQLAKCLGKLVKRRPSMERK